MEVQLAVLADCANIAAGDKLNLMGVFDTVQAKNFPTRHAFMALAIRFRCDFEDGGRQHKVVVSLRDEDEREHLRAEAAVNIPAVPAGEIIHLNQVLNFAGMVFTKPGRFAFHVSCNDSTKARVDLKVAAAPAGRL